MQPVSFALYRIYAKADEGDHAHFFITPSSRPIAKLSLLLGDLHVTLIAGHGIDDVF
jgi:hypothetical protein